MLGLIELLVALLSVAVSLAITGAALAWRALVWAWPVLWLFVAASVGQSFVAGILEPVFGPSGVSVGMSAGASIGVLVVVWGLRAAGKCTPERMLWGAVAAGLFSLYLMGVEVARVLSFVGQLTRGEGRVTNPVTFVYLDVLAIGGAAIGLLASAVTAYVAAHQGAEFFPRPAGYRRSRNATFGSAAWLAVRDALELFKAGDLIIGEGYDPSKSPGQAGAAPLLRFSGRGHALVVAGSGAGKTTAFVIPNLLTWRSGVVVLDPKGELVRITAGARVQMGQKVFVLDTDSPASHGFNPLADLDSQSEQIVERVAAVVSWLIPSSVRTSTGSDEFFKTNAARLLEALMLDLVCDEDTPTEKKNVRELYRRLSLPAEDLRELLNRIHERPERHTFGAAQHFAGSLAGLVPETFDGIAENARGALKWLAAPSLARLVCRDDFKPADIIDGGATVYLAVSTETLSSSPGLARLVLGTLLAACYRTAKQRGTFDRRILFLLDEFPRLGRFQPAEQALAIGRGAGVTLAAICQDLGQLEKAYGKEGVRGWLESSEVSCFFGINDFSTAEYVSKACGEATIITRSKSEGSGRGRGDLAVLGQSSYQEGTSDAEQRRMLITPGEVRTLTVDREGLPDEQIVFARGRQPLRCGLAKWYRRAEFKRAIEEGRTAPLPILAGATPAVIQPPSITEPNECSSPAIPHTRWPSDPRKQAWPGAS